LRFPSRKFLLWDSAETVLRNSKDFAVNQMCSKFEQKSQDPVAAPRPPFTPLRVAFAVDDRQPTKQRRLDKLGMTAQQLFTAMLKTTNVNISRTRCRSMIHSIQFKSSRPRCCESEGEQRYPGELHRQRLPFLHRNDARSPYNDVLRRHI